MASYREIKRRIGGVRNIQQITRAMKMVAAARLRRAEQAILALRPYASRLDSLCARFLGDAVGGEHPFMEESPTGGVAVLSICSDKGLCGAYNNRVVEATDRLLTEKAGRKRFLLAVGHRGVSRLARAGWRTHRTYEEVFDPVRFTTAQSIRQELEQLFLRRDVGEVVTVFTEFFSPIRQVVITRRLLPCPPGQQRRQLEDYYGRELPSGLEAETAQMDEAAEQLYIYEPDYEIMCGRLLEYNLTVQVYRALLEAQASEHGARMMAMDSATENAEEMIEELTLLMNRVRQEDITREILDVVGGAEAVK